MRLLLKNLRWYSEGRVGSGDLRVRGGRILELGEGLAPARGERVLEARGQLALPGLVNGHDHLELDLMPHLGNPPYPNAGAWAEAIYHPDRSPLRELLRVPLRDRLLWGGYKNLIAGATTVAHHNPYYRRTFGRRFPVKVLRAYAWQHSLRHPEQNGGRWRRMTGDPFLIHAAEGIDAGAGTEIARLEGEGRLDARTVVVHAVAIREAHIGRIEAAGASVVWCPASNLRLFHTTAPIALLQGRVRLALGTDSTLSGSPTLLHELRAAHATGLASPEELLEMVTASAASVFALGDGRGTLRSGGPADVLLLPDCGGSPAESLLAAAPGDLALVLVDGEPRLASPSAARALELGEATERVDGQPKWIYGELAALRQRIESVAGPAVLAAQPLWSLLS